MSRQRWWGVFLAGLLLSLAVLSAQAHAELLTAVPAPGSQLQESPVVIRLTFSEALAADSQIVLRNRSFAPLSGVSVRVLPDEPNILEAQLRPLAPGVYTVEYVAVGSDGHPVSGSYEFSLTAPAEDTAGVGVWLPLILGGGALLGLLLLLQRGVGRPAGQPRR